MISQQTKNYLLSLLFILVAGGLLYFFSTKVVIKNADWKEKTSQSTSNESEAQLSLDSESSQLSLPEGGDLELPEGCIVLQNDEVNEAYGGFGEDIRGGVLCATRLVNSGPVYDFYVHVDPVTNVPLGVEYGAGEVGAKYLAFSNSKESYVGVPPTADFLIFEDVNFDGHKDMKVISNVGATGNTSYMVNVFDIKSQEFVYDEDFSAIMNLETDAKAKLIRSSVNAGSAGFAFIREVYRVDGGKPLLIEQISQEKSGSWDTLAFTRTVRRLIQGKLQKVSEEIVYPELER